MKPPEPVPFFTPADLPHPIEVCQPVVSVSDCCHEFTVRATVEGCNVTLHACPACGQECKPITFSMN